MTENLDARLLNWLNEQGYPLEMAVARLFRQYGFRVFQSDYYVDPETNTQREIDISAHKQRMRGEVLLRISINVECKNAKDKPWVIFSSSDIQLSSIARVVQRAGSQLAIQFLQFLAGKQEIQDLPLFSFPQRPGYGITQAFSSGQDVPYTACMGAAKSAAAAASSGDTATKLQGPLCDIIFPVVVVEGKLFECYLGENNNPTLEEIEKGILVWRNPIVGMPHTIIHVLTIAGLPNFLQQINESIDRLFSRDLEIEQINSVAKEAKGPRWRSRRKLNDSEKSERT